MERGVNSPPPILKRGEGIMPELWITSNFNPPKDGLSCEKCKHGYSNPVQATPCLKIGSLPWDDECKLFEKLSVIPTLTCPYCKKEMFQYFEEFSWGGGKKKIQSEWVGMWKCNCRYSDGKGRHIITDKSLTHESESEEKEL